MRFQSIYIDLQNVNLGTLTELTVSVVHVGIEMETLTQLNSFDLNRDMIRMNEYECLNSR